MTRDEKLQCKQKSEFQNRSIKLIKFYISLSPSRKYSSASVYGMLQRKHEMKLNAASHKKSEYKIPNLKKQRHNKRDRAQKQKYEHYARFVRKRKKPAKLEACRRIVSNKTRDQPARRIRTNPVFRWNKMKREMKRKQNNRPKKKKPVDKWLTSLMKFDTGAVPIITRKMSQHFESWKECQKKGCTADLRGISFPACFIGTGIVTRSFAQRMYTKHRLAKKLKKPPIAESKAVTIIQTKNLPAAPMERVQAPKYRHVSLVSHTGGKRVVQATVSRAYPIMSDKRKLVLLRRVCSYMQVAGVLGPGRKRYAICGPSHSGVSDIEQQHPEEGSSNFNERALVRVERSSRRSRRAYRMSRSPLQSKSCQVPADFCGQENVGDSLLDVKHDAGVQVEIPTERDTGDHNRPPKFIDTAERGKSSEKYYLDPYVYCFKNNFGQYDVIRRSPSSSRRRGTRPRKSACLIRSAKVQHSLASVISVVSLTESELSVESEEVTPIYKSIGFVPHCRERCKEDDTRTSPFRKMTLEPQPQCDTHRLNSNQNRSYGHRLVLTRCRRKTPRRIKSKSRSPLKDNYHIPSETSADLPQCSNSKAPPCTPVSEFQFQNRSENSLRQSGGNIVGSFSQEFDTHHLQSNPGHYPNPATQANTGNETSNTGNSIIVTRHSIRKTSGNSICKMNRNSIGKMNRNSLGEMNRNSIDEMNKNSIVEMNRNSLAEINKNSLGEINRNSIDEMNGNSTCKTTGNSTSTNGVRGSFRSQCHPKHAEQNLQCEPSYRHSPRMMGARNHLDADQDMDVHSPQRIEDCQMDCDCQRNQSDYKLQNEPLECDGRNSHLDHYVPEIHLDVNEQVNYCSQERQLADEEEHGQMDCDSRNTENNYYCRNDQLDYHSQIDGLDYHCRNGPMDHDGLKGQMDYDDPSPVTSAAEQQLDSVFLEESENYPMGREDEILSTAEALSRLEFEANTQNGRSNSKKRKTGLALCRKLMSFWS